MKWAEKWKEAAFSEDTVNGGRQPELDMAKAILIFCLALVHCMIECTPEERLSYGIPFLLDSVIGEPMGAPMFMFAMGFGMVYTKHHTPKDYMLRGIRIGITGYVLNICRFLVPFLAGYLITGDYGKYIEPLPYRVLGNDILQFAALAMLVISLFVRLHVPNAGMFFICLVMSIIGTALNGLDAGTPFGNIFLGYLVGTEDAAGKMFSDFPLLNWLIIPVGGYIFGEYLLHVKNKKLFYGILSTAGMLAAVVYFPAGIRNGWGMFGEGQNCYYHLVTTDAIVCLAVTVGMIGIYYVIVRYLPEKVLACTGEISRNINAVYCIHWVFVMVNTNVVLYILQGTQELPVPATLLLGTCISIVSILMAHGWTFHLGGRGRTDRGGEKMNQHRLGMKALAGLFILAVVIILSTCLTIDIRYKKERMTEYNDMSFSYARTAAEYIDGDKVHAYVETNVEDDYYRGIQNFLEISLRQTDLEYYSVFVPYETDLVYVWDVGDGEEAIAEKTYGLLWLLTGYLRRNI